MCALVLTGMEPLTKIVIGAAYEVSNTLGTGFLEKIYENALMAELRSNGLQVESQAALTVVYKGHEVGTYYADLLVERRMIVELKCVDQLSEMHRAQCLNYLRASGLKLALLMNFQRNRVDIRRVLHD